MSTDLGWAYDVLGVKPGISDRELKAAHRDLTKVWHPDRFLHDPRLQEKAQEKLKEINEAYEQLLSRHTRRPTPPPRRPQTSTAASSVQYSANIPRRRGIGWHWYVAGPLVVFALVFAVTTRSLVRDRVPQLFDSPETVASDQQPEASQPAQSSQPDSNHAARNRSDNNLAPAPEPQTETVPTNEAVPAVPTVTVSIDPANGLLATPACPVKTRMTYPSGSQPGGYCNIVHTPPPKESRIKSIKDKILR